MKSITGLRAAAVLGTVAFFGSLIYLDFKYGHDRRSKSDGQVPVAVSATQVIARKSLVPMREAYPLSKARPGFVDTEKLHLDMVKLLASSKDFQQANPGLSVNDLQGQGQGTKVLSKDVVIPLGVHINVQRVPGCGRVPSGLKHGEPYSMTQLVGDGATLQSLEVSAEQDPCTSRVTFDRTSLREAAKQGPRLKPVDPQAPQKARTVNQMLVQAAESGVPLPIAYIGQPADLLALDPTLYGGSDQKHNTSAQVSVTSDQGQQKVAPVTRWPYPGSGVYAKTEITDSFLSNMIVWASIQGARVINVVISDVDLDDFAPALSYAQGKGVVVNFLPTGK